jgi:hypothetical protein
MPSPLVFGGAAQPGAQSFDFWGKRFREGSGVGVLKGVLQSCRFV